MMAELIAYYVYSIWTESCYLIYERIKAHENMQLYYSTSFKIRIFDIYFYQ